MHNSRAEDLIILIITSIYILLAASWINNAIKLSECDFEANYRCELIHSIGLIIPQASLITTWFGTDKS